MGMTYPYKAQAQSSNNYHIAGNFRGRKLSQIGGEQEIRKENFRGLLGATN